MVGAILTVGIVLVFAALVTLANLCAERQRRPEKPWKATGYTYTQGEFGDYDQGKAMAGARAARSRTATGRPYAPKPVPGNVTAMPRRGRSA